MEKLEQYCKATLAGLRDGTDFTDNRLLLMAYVTDVYRLSTEYTQTPETPYSVVRSFLCDQMTPDALAAFDYASREDGPSREEDQPSVEPPPFKPAFTEDLFIHTKSVELVVLLACFLRYWTLYHVSRKQWAVANLLSVWSDLPLRGSDSGIAVREITSAPVLMAAARDADAGNLETLLNALYKEAMTANPLEYHFYALYDWAKIKNMLNRPKEVEKLIQDILTNSCGPSEYDTARKMNVGYSWICKAHARAVLKQGRTSEAVEILMKAKDATLEVFGQETLNYLHILLLLAELYRGKELFDAEKARKYESELHDLFKQMYGYSKAKVSGAEGMMMGKVLMTQGAVEEAEIVLKEYVPLAEEQLGDDHDITKMARVLRDQAIREREQVEIWDSLGQWRMDYGCVTYMRDISKIGVSE